MHRFAHNLKILLLIFFYLTLVEYGKALWTSIQKFYVEKKAFWSVIIVFPIGMIQPGFILYSGPQKSWPLLPFIFCRSRGHDFCDPVYIMMNNIPQKLGCSSLQILARLWQQGGTRSAEISTFLINRVPVYPGLLLWATNARVFLNRSWSQRTYLKWHGQSELCLVINF